MESAFGIDHGEVSKGLTRAAGKGLLRLSRRGSAGKRKEWATQRLTRHVYGQGGQKEAGRAAKKMEQGLLEKITSNTYNAPLRKTPAKVKPKPVGLRGSLAERGLVQAPKKPEPTNYRLPGDPATPRLRGKTKANRKYNGVYGGQYSRNVTGRTGMQ